MKHSIGIIIGLLILIVVAMNIRSMLYKHRLLENDWKRVNQQKTAVQQEKSRLLKVVQEGKTKEEREREVRLMLGYKKKGEKVVLVVPPSTITGEAATSTPPLRKSSWLSRITKICYSLKRIGKYFHQVIKF